MNKLQKIQAVINDLKKDQLSEIMNSFVIFESTKQEFPDVPDDILLNLQKLRLIRDYDLFYREIYVQDIFSKLKNDWKTELEKKYPDQKYFIINDNIISPDIFDRYSTVDLLYFIDSILENDELNDDIIVFTDRSTKEVYKMRAEDVVRHIINWCFDNECIQFEFDW